MVVDPEELQSFSKVVIDHATHPRNAGSIEDADAYASVLGSCGDNMEMWLKARDEIINDLCFWIDGYSATIICGSIATEQDKRKTLGEALPINTEVIYKSLGELPKEHIHCAGFASLTLKKAITEYMNLQKEPWKKVYQRYR
jgi:nitrogen fixation protein NifU and related proteins